MYKFRPVGKIGNYYGGLFIMEKNGKYYWLIKNFDTAFEDLRDWTEITKKLYDLLLREESKSKDDT